MSVPALGPPVVLVASCRHTIDGHDYHAAGRKYVEAARLAGALPLIVAPCPEDEIDALLALAHGVLLTGSLSNVHPSHFGEPVHDPALPLDPERDGWTLKLIPKALARGIPLLAICRGLQEVNVALGGALHQAVHEMPGLDDHRPARGGGLELAYGPAHRVAAVPGGVLHGIVGASSFEVNSLHGQGIKTLAPGLKVEAVAPDGLVEAFSQPAAPAFNLCVQWHAEWQAAGNPVSRKILAAFGAAARACRDRASSSLAQAPA